MVNKATKIIEDIRRGTSPQRAPWCRSQSSERLRCMSPSVASECSRGERREEIREDIESREEVREREVKKKKERSGRQESKGYIQREIKDICMARGRGRTKSEKPRYEFDTSECARSRPAMAAEGGSSHCPRRGATQLRAMHLQGRIRLRRVS